MEAVEDAKFHALQLLKVRATGNQAKTILACTFDVSAGGAGLGAEHFLPCS